VNLVFFLRSEISLVVMLHISLASYNRPMGTPRYRYDSSFERTGIPPCCTLNTVSPTRVGSLLLHVRDSEAHLSGWKFRFKISTAKETSLIGIEGRHEFDS
jgi:hypothetical protein